MKRLIIVFGLFILLVSCKKEEKIISHQVFLGGEIVYFDNLSEDTIREFSGVEITLINDIAVPSWTRLNDTNSIFLLGPLDTGKYKIEAEYINPLTDISYSLNDSVDFDSISIGKIQDYSGVLNPNYNYTLLYKITDTLGNPVTGVDVFLYNNYGMLELYQANSSAALETKTTNSKGNVVFHNLSSDSYFVYAQKIIPTGGPGFDTLTNYNLTFDPNLVPALIKDDLNSDNTEIK